MSTTTTDMRSHIHQIVTTLKPLDRLEQEHIQFVLDWIESGSDLFRIEKPAIPDIHLVCYFVVAAPNMDKVLLVDHKKAELWLPPGGHVEPNEDPKETVRREAIEELGLMANFVVDTPLFLTVTTTVGNVTRHTDVSLWYLLRANPYQEMIYDRDEFNNICWFALDDIPYEKSDPHMKRFIQKMCVIRG